MMTTDNALSDWLMGLIRCPNTGTELMLAPRDTLERIRTLHGQGQLRTKLGRTLSQIPTQGLVSADGRWFYPIERGIACLLPDEACDLQALLNP